MADNWDAVERGKSLASGFNDADPEAILAWNNRMAELVQMNDIAELISSHTSVSKASLPSSLTKIQTEWLDRRINRSDLSNAMRLHYYVGRAVGGVEGEQEVLKAFGSLSSAILASTLADLKENTEATIAIDTVEIDLPLRVNWGGGWSDTPPYCNENGGTVLNAAKEVIIRFRITSAEHDVFL